MTCFVCWVILGLCVIIMIVSLEVLSDFISLMIFLVVVVLRFFVGLLVMSSVGLVMSVLVMVTCCC